MVDGWSTSAASWELVGWDERVTEEGRTEDLRTLGRNSAQTSGGGGGARECALLGCSVTLMLPSLWLGTFRSVRVWGVQLSGPVTHLLQLPLGGMDDPRALDELRFLVQRSFRTLLWGFAGKWLGRANAPADRVGLVPVTPLWKNGWGGDKSSIWACSLSKLSRSC